jgi:flagellar biosynthetic protein FliR
MSELTQLLSSRWPEVITFLLVLGRTSGLVISAPFWGGRAVPGLVRVVVAVSLSVAVYPLAKPAGVGAQHAASLLFLLTALGGEVLLGLVLGWAAQLLFAGMRLAGQEIEIKMGLGLAQLVDPQEGGQTTVLSTLFELMAALVFFSLNGHHLLIRALASSYSLFPLAEVGAHGRAPLLSAVEGMVVSTGEIFTIALRVSAPVVAGLLLSDIVLGIVSRAIPQMNVFVVALPLQLAFGMLLLLLSLPALVWFCVNQLSAISTQLSAVSLVPSGGG